MSVQIETAASHLRSNCSKCILIIPMKHSFGSSGYEAAQALENGGQSMVPILTIGLSGIVSGQRHGRLEVSPMLTQPESRANEPSPFPGRVETIILPEEHYISQTRIDN